MPPRDAERGRGAGRPAKRQRCPLGGADCTAAIATGPRTAKGLARMRKAKTTHGGRMAEMEQVRKVIRDLKAGAKRLVELA
jgi:hypothetical protein